MTNISQEMTHFTEEGCPNTLGFFLSLVTFGSPRAVVNVLPCYKMSWVHTIITMSSTCASGHVYTHRDVGAGTQDWF